MSLNGNRTMVATACAVAPSTLSGSFDWVVVVVVVDAGAWAFTLSVPSLSLVITGPPSDLVTLVVVVVRSPLEHPWASTTAQDAIAAANNTASRFILGSSLGGSLTRPCRAGPRVGTVRADKIISWLAAAQTRVSTADEEMAKRNARGGVTEAATRRIVIGYGGCHLVGKRRRRARGGSP